MTERPDVTYHDIGGLDIQKQEIREAIELPLTQFELYRVSLYFQIHVCDFLILIVNFEIF